MKNVLKFGLLGVCSAIALVSCNDQEPTEPKNYNPFKLTPEATSKTPNFLKLESEFSKVKVYPLLSSEDKLEATPDFVYGSMADGAGLLANADGKSYTLINNIEADYSVARITLDQNLRPTAGEYILNAEATGYTAQCSGSLVTPEEHGFGPLYLSGGEWGGASKGVFVTQIDKEASLAGSGNVLTALGQWSVENAVVIGKDAYKGKTVAFIGDDKGNNDTPVGDLGMYVGNRGDLYGGKLYGMKVKDTSVAFEVDMAEGKTYDVEFVELMEREIDALEKECRDKGVIAFSRVEDIDWRRGDAKANREVYFVATGRNKPGLVGKGTIYGRIYKLQLNDTDPTGAAKLTCVLDGDKENGKAKLFHSPDNIVVTKNYAYIQEDPNGYFDNENKMHYASLYQYDLNTGDLKKVLECDQVAAAAQGYGNTEKPWEITGMIDVSDVIGVEGSFIVITQNHGWVKEGGIGFTDPKANAKAQVKNGWTGELEGSVLYVIQGLDR